MLFWSSNTNSPRVKTFPLNTIFGGLQSIFPRLIFSSESHELWLQDEPQVHSSFEFAIDLAAVSMKLANWTSLSDKPLQSCVLRVICTLLYTLNHLGWCSIFSAFNATRVINPNTWLKSLNRNSFWMASQPSTSTHPAFRDEGSVPFLFVEFLPFRSWHDLITWVPPQKSSKTLWSYASVNSTCAQQPPPPGNCGAFAHLVSPGGGAFANVALPGGRAFANFRANPELLTRMRFPIRI